MLLSGLIIVSGLQSGHIGVLTTSSQSSLPASSEVISGTTVPDISVPKTYTVQITAYSSTADQTDDTPFVGAAGYRVHDGIVAANFLPFGTKLTIPSLFGNKIFTVEDRMNRRMKNGVDIWMATRGKALRFGVIKAEIVLISESQDTQLAEK